MSDDDTNLQQEVTKTNRGKILVVDDDAHARTSLADFLRSEGYEIVTAADGLKALPKLDELAPDLVLTDLQMPGLDGLGLLKKALEAEFEPAVIVMTAHGAIESAVAAMRAGASDYLSKPLNLDELGILLERAQCLTA